MKRVQRLVKILQLIDGGNIGRLGLANKFEVSERQIYRDVESLIEAEFPITYSKKTGAYSFHEGCSLKKISLHPSELQVLLIAKQVLSSVGDGLASDFDSFLFRLLHESKKSSAFTMPPISILMDTAVNSSEIGALYQNILYAIDEREQVEIDHRGQDGVYGKRQIDPYRLFHSDGFWYVIGYCHLREDIRTFALDKIRSVTLLRRYFAIRNSFNFDSYMANCWKKYYLGEPEAVTIRFSPEAAKDIKRKKWHPSQEIKANQDGSIDFTVTISGYDEIMKWILSWGGNARVIFPVELREKIKKEATRIAKQ